MNHPPHLTPWHRFRAAWVVVGVAALPLVLLFGAQFAADPSTLVVVPFLAIPALVLLGTLVWLDRHEPEPRDAVLLALLWGGIVAGAVAGAVNSAVAYAVGETAAAVVSAPVVEELGKGAVLLLLLRRRLINSPMDGVVYVFCSAAGFAIVEDLLYFIKGVTEEGAAGLAAVVVMRGILTPFAHPLFSLPMGFALGWVAQRRPPSSAGVLTGAVGISMLLHAAWNGGLVVSAMDASGRVFLVMLLGFVSLFGAAVVVVLRTRAGQARWFDQVSGRLVLHLNLTPGEAELFSDTGRYLRYLGTLPAGARSDLRELRWNLHALAATLSHPARNSVERAEDGTYAAFLIHRVELLRHRLMSTCR